MKWYKKITDYNGFTIVETIIFFAVSAAMFAAMIGVINGQTRRTGFTQSVHTAEQNIRDLINDVETGYFATSNERTTCGSNTATRGTNEGCIFLGKALQFAPNENRGAYKVYTVIGKRLSGSSGQTSVTNLPESNPIPYENGSVEEKFTLDASLEFSKVAVGGTNSGGFAILSSFGALDSSSNSSGNIRSSLWNVNGTALGNNSSTFKDRISATGLVSTAQPITLCVQESDGSRTAAINIGYSNQELSVSSVIDPPSGVCEL